MARLTYPTRQPAFPLFPRSVVNAIIRVDGCDEQTADETDRRGASAYIANYYCPGAAAFPPGKSFLRRVADRMSRVNIYGRQFRAGRARNLIDEARPPVGEHHAELNIILRSVEDSFRHR